MNLDFLPRKDLVHFKSIATTKENFVWSSETAVSDSQKVVSALAHKVTDLSCKIVFGQLASLSPRIIRVSSTSTRWLAKHITNTSGGQSDRIVRICGLSKNFLMAPFMGIYSYVELQQLHLKKLVYPVPNLLNPFLEVHFTLTSGGCLRLVLSRFQF